MHLFTADGFEGEPIACDEGELEWVDIDKIESLHIWEGDKIFLRLLAEKAPFFSLKLVYDGHDGLISAVLNGKEIKKGKNYRKLSRSGTPVIEKESNRAGIPLECRCEILGTDITGIISIRRRSKE